MSDNIKTVSPANLATLREKIATLNKRAVKLGCPPATLTVVGETTVKISKVMPGGRVMDYEEPRLLVKVEGETPKLEGWCLVAAIEYLGEERLIRCVPGETCPEEFRTRGLECDHCQTSRNRREVFVLRHEDGRHVQVGRSCLADFLGGVSPELLLRQAEWGFTVSKELADAEDGWGGYCDPDVINIEEYLCGVSICVRRLGWCSRSAAGDFRATAGDAWHLLKPYTKTDDDRRRHQRWVETNNLYYQDRDQETAQKALEWARSQPTTGVGDYLYNLGVACRISYVTRKTSGLVASAVLAHLRHLEREEEIARKKREDASKVRGHVGKKKERREFDVTVKLMRWFNGQYGTKTLVKMEDEVGNILIWWASREVDELEEGDTVRVKATVKDHTDYNGTPQTVVNRLVVQERLEVTT